MFVQMFEHLYLILATNRAILFSSHSALNLATSQTVARRAAAYLYSGFEPPQQQNNAIISEGVRAEGCISDACHHRTGLSGG